MKYLMYNIIKFKESIDCDNLNYREKRKRFFKKSKTYTKRLNFIHTQ